MKLLLIRRTRRPDYTIGRLLVNGTPLCDTLEDCVREGAKVYGETAIPYGIYTIRMTMSPRFKRVLPELLDVPGFTGIRIHAGNTAKDTQGCILVGENLVRGAVLNSRRWEKKLTDLLLDAADRGEPLTIEVI